MIVLKNYENREKGLLRHALTGVLPDDVLWRRKSPYPKTHNLSYFNMVHQWLLAILDDTSSPLLGLVDAHKLRSIAQGEDERGNIPWFGQLMSRPQLFAYLIQLDTWLRSYKVEIV
jgi:asparagine synthase (glutamine-hydrolysing)